MRICSEEAILGFPETTFNLMPGCGGIMRLIGLSGVARTLELVLHGNLYPCKDALSYGMVDRILPKKVLFSSVEDLIERISDGYDRNKIKEYVKLMK
jgi:enoyl-CoA hydratase/carnithine racemase